MKKIIYVFILTILCSHLKGQVKDSTKTVKFEFSKYRSNKKIFLKEGRSIDVILTDTNTSFRNYESFDHSISGSLINLTDTFLILDYFSEVIEYEYTYGNKVLSSWGAAENIHKNIPIRQIKYIEYETNLNQPLAYFFGLSALTCLIIAPVVSINYGNHFAFNSNRYTSIARPSLISTLTGMILYSAFRTKKVKMK